MSAGTMRNSGIEWIGDVPPHWEFKRLKYTSTLAGRIGWQGLTSEEYRTEGVHLVTGTDFKEGRIDWDSCVRVSEARWAEATQVQLREGDLLITKDGTVGKVAKCVDLPGKASLNSGVMVIRHKVPMSTHFLYWVLQSPVFTGWFSDANAGASTISHLYQADFYNFGFYVPPTVREQEPVASLLDAETAKIDQAMSLLRRELETMEQLKKSLVYEAVTKGLDPTVPMRPSGVDWIGDIPEHWVTKRLRYVASAKTGQTPPSDDPTYFDGPVTWYTPSDINNDHVYGSARTLTLKAVSEGRAPLISAGVTLFVGIGATIGKVGFSNSACSFNQQITALPTSTDSAEWLFNAMQAQRDFIVGQALFTTLPIVNNGSLGNLLLPIPPAGEQSEIAATLNKRISHIDQIVAVKKQQSETLTRQRESLIFEYVTGKRRVNEVA